MYLIIKQVKRNKKSKIKMSSTSLPPPLWSIDMHHSPNLANNVQLSLYKNQFDQESVRSVLSERSKKQNRNQKGMDINHINSNHVMVSSLSPYSELDHNRLTHTLQSQSTNRHSHHLFKSDRNYKSKGNYEIPSEKRRTNEVIEVQIIPQDDTWGDNTTAITGNTSERSISIDMELNKIGKEDFLSNLSFTSKLWMWLWPVITVLISFCAFFSPIIMILLPKIESLEWKVKECGPECDGQLINFAFKLLILLICTWALFFRSPKYTLPRICNYRSTILTLIIFLLISYWLFYSERIIDKRFNDYELSYYSIIQFSVSFIDVLLWIHYASIILIEIKQLQPTYFVKVVRSPDGESHFYNIGELSVQRAAIWILQKYYQDFSIYNPYLETLPRKTSKSKPFNKVGPINNHNHINLPNSTLKYYNVDEITNSSNVENILLNPSSGSTLNQVTNRLSMNGNANGISETIQSNCFDSRSSKRSCFSSHHHHHHNERFYEEHEYERRVKKRKARLLTSVEEAFTHIKRIQANESGIVFHLIFVCLKIENENKKRTS